MIERIEDNEGKVLYQHEIQPVPVFSEQTAYLITDMLRTVVNAGTGTHIRQYIPRSVDVAGKTGTTNNNHDLSFVGYTPELSLGVWSGYDEPHPLPDRQKYQSMKIWGKVMKAVMALDPKLSPADAKFEKPRDIVSFTVDSKSGLLPSELTKEAGHLITDLFNRQFIPTKTDDSHQKARIVQYNQERYLAKEGTPDDFVSEGIFFRSPDPLPPADQIQAQNKRVPTRPPDWDQRLPDKEDPRTEVPGQPAPPHSVTIARTNNQIVLTWKSAGEADLLGYRLYRADVSSGFVHIATIKDPAIFTYTDTTATSGEYGYYLTAVDITGQESQPSAIVSSGQVPGWQLPAPLPADENDAGNIQPDAPTGNVDEGWTQPPDQTGPPSAPSGVTLKKTSNGMKLDWEANPDREQVFAYNIYYTPDPVNGFLLLDTVSSTSYVHKGADAGGWYYITAVNTFGESPNSNSVHQ
jgi:penicillin-binding protein